MMPLRFLSSAAELGDAKGACAMRYALHIFPQFASMEEIEKIRARYAPLFGRIPPHVTLVFPFEA